jgi:hypothetical protein
MFLDSVLCVLTFCIWKAVTTISVIFPLNIEVASFFRKLVTPYQTTQHHNPDDQSTNQHSLKNLILHLGTYGYLGAATVNRDLRQRRWISHQDPTNIWKLLQNRQRPLVSPNFLKYIIHLYISWEFVVQTRSFIQHYLKYVIEKSYKYAKNSAVITS